MFSTNNYFTNAQYMHDHLPLVTNNDKLYAWQSQLGINLFSEGNTWLGLDTASQDSLKHIVQYNKAAGYGAGGLASFLGIGAVTWPVALFDTLAIDSILALIDTSHVAYRKANISGGSITNVNKEEIQPFSIYPNPSLGNFTIKTTGSGKFVLYTLPGQKLQEYKISSGQNDFQLPKNISPGLYLGEYLSDNGGVVNKVQIIYKP